MSPPIRFSTPTPTYNPTYADETSDTGADTDSVYSPERRDSCASPQYIFSFDAEDLAQVGKYLVNNQTTPSSACEAIDKGGKGVSTNQNSRVNEMTQEDL